MIPPEWIDQAARRIAGQIYPSPLTYDPDLQIFLKWENRQKTGSFKVRGALNKVLSLQSWELARGLVTASAGNHGQGVAAAGRLAGARTIVFASDRAVPAKLEAMRAQGAELRLVQGGYGEAEKAGKAYAAETGSVWVSPYNDGQVIAGQATVVLEVQEQLAPKIPGAVIVPVGGGGLISGIGAALQRVSPRPRLVGVQSEASPFFHALYHRGTSAGVIDLESLADGLAGPVEADSMTIAMVRQLVDDFLLVTEEQIARAVAYAWMRHNERIEGAGAAALAVALHGLLPRAQEPGRPGVAIISGGNMQPEVHARLLEQFRSEWDEKPAKGAAR